MATILDRFEATVRTDPTRPLLTWYQPSTSARIELSGATAGTWVDKLAGLLRDGCDVQPGDTVAVELGAHWLGLLIPLAAWRAEAALTDSPNPTIRVLPAALATPIGGVTVLAAPAGPLAMPEPTDAAVVDLAREVRVHPDRYSGPRPTPQDVAMRPPETTHAELAAAAAAVGYGAEDRVLAVGSAAAPLLTSWFGVVVAGASLVVVDGEDATVAAAEAITRIA